MLRLKFQTIREEDYWLYPIIFFNIVFTATALYASALPFRAPAVVLAFLGIWFTSNKMRRDYSPTRSRIHIAIILTLAILLAWAAYALTN